MRYRHLKYTIFCLTAILIISISSFYFHNSPFDHNNNDKNNNIDQVENVQSPETPKIAASEPNGKPLLVHQYANISKSFNDIDSGENVSFTLYNDWISQNTTINYEGIEQKRDIITNGAFDTDDSGWVFKTNIPSKLEKKDWSDGITGIYGPNTGRSTGDYGYLEQNISLQNEELRDNIATFSFDYNSEWGIYFNASLFMSVIIGNIEVNHSVYTLDISPKSWFILNMIYNPFTFGQVLPGVVTIRVGVIMNEDSGPGWISMFLDNFKCELWTRPNEEGIIKAYDNQFPQNHTYYNTTFGEGYSFIDTERTPDSDNQIDFTIYSNRSEVLDFHIDKITVISHAIKKYNSTVSNKLGSIYSLGENISWHVEFSLIIHNNYYCWVFIEKPSDWEFIHAIDSFQADKIEFCLGKDLGSKVMKIPLDHISEGLWKLEAYSQNYITNGTIGVWNDTAFESTTTLTIDDLFMVDVTLNDSISLPNTQINCTIFYPNASIFWQTSEEPTSYNEKFGNFTVGKNMTVGNYLVRIEWVNNISSIEIDKVGYMILNFIVWHSTNLTAINSYIEKIAGDPCLIKVNYTDYDLDTYIAFAEVTYKSTFGQSVTMIYIGSGVYFLDLDTSSLGLGDYYFSFNASKIYYENLTANDLIHLKIIAQPLAIKVPGSAVDAMGNNYAICNVNVSGALSGTPIYPANVSTEWTKWYNVTDNNDGSYSLNFSTNGIPTQGILQTFTINVFANKTDYGSTSNFITLIVHPIPTAISVNKSLHNVYINEVFYVKINYTIEASGTFISGANCTIIWLSNYLIIPVADGYIVRFDTIGLSIDVHAALITMKHVGFETEYISVTAIVGEQDVNLTVIINAVEITENSLIELYFKESINISVRVWAIGDLEYLSGDILTWISDNYQVSLTESPPTYFNSSIIMDAANFTNGINYINIRFQQENYTTKLFSFQLFLNEQEVNLTVYINAAEISENTLIDLYFQEKFNISARAFALAEKIYLSGGLITIISDPYEENLTESPNTYFNLSIIMDGAYFNPGINYVYLLFQQGNYSTKTFSFQLFIRTQSVNLTLLIDAEQVQENYLVETYFNNKISLSSRAYAEGELIYLANCTITFINNIYEKNLTKTVNYWYNTSIEISTSDFNLGNNYVYVRFTRTNYSAVTFSFQILVKQISIDVDFVDIEDSIEAFAGETIKIEIKLTEELSGKPIEDADISYDWEFGVGEFEEKGDGVYEVELEIPENIEGNYDFELIISKSGSVYRSSEEDLTISVKERELPEYWIWIIIAALSIGVGLLAAISLRAYVFLPRARKKESELLAKTQNFKDMGSIQAIVLIHRNSGLPLYYKTYSFLKHADAHLFSGFVQAITTIGKEIAESDKGAKLTEKQRRYAEHMMEIDFKYFYALIYDHEDLRLVLILNQRSSDALREKLKDLSLTIMEELGDSIKDFDGLLEPFELAVPSILSKSIDLHYKEFFKISNDKALFLKTKKERDMSSLESRLFNVLTSYSKGGNNFALVSIFKMISEKNEDLIIEAIESLIKRKLIIPTEGNSGSNFSKGSSYK
jgi:hypothetical protein